MGHQPAQLVVDRGRRAATIVVRAPAVDVKVVEPVEDLLRQALEADVHRVELDLSEVSFADSSVVRLALKAREHVAPVGGEVVIKAPDRVRRLFELTRTTELFSIVPVASNGTA
jgi:anti-anti-sigma factor